ncbi:MAG: hypothetical protein WDO24_11645 [Pseudomonadota bacterium]
MSVSAISSNQFSLDPTLAASSGLTGNLQSLADNYNALGTALQEGDLGGAQTAFTSLMQAAPSTGAGTPAAGSSQQRGQQQRGRRFRHPGAGAAVRQSAGRPAGLRQPAAGGAERPAGRTVRGTSHGAKGASAGGSGGSGASASASGASGDSSTVVSEVTVTNANGTLTRHQHLCRRHHLDGNRAQS